MAGPSGTPGGAGGHFEAPPRHKRKAKRGKKRK